MITDSSFFVGEIALPNLDKAAQAAKIAEAIETYEDEILRKVLGEDLFYSYQDDDTTDRFKDLIDGGVDFTFTLNGKIITRKWAGLKVKGQSFIACYIYYWYLTNNVSITTGVGEVSATTENSTKVPITDKVVKAINRASDLIGQDMPSNKMELESYMHSNDAASLFNYLLANKSIFPEWVFTPLKKINVFGF